MSKSIYSRCSVQHCRVSFLKTSHMPFIMIVCQSMTLVCGMFSLKRSTAPALPKTVYACKMKRFPSSRHCRPSSSSSSASLPSICSLFSHYHTITLCPTVFPCLPAPRCTPVPPSLAALVAILCHFMPFLASFSPHASPFSSITIKPFHAFLKFPRPPPRSRPLFPSVYLLLLSVSSSRSLPLRSAHLQHIKIPLFFLQRIVQSLRDLLHSFMFSLLPCHICLPLARLCILAAFNSVCLRLCLFNTFVSLLRPSVFLFPTLLE